MTNILYLLKSKECPLTSRKFSHSIFSTDVTDTVMSCDYGVLPHDDGNDDALLADGIPREEGREPDLRQLKT